MSDAISNDFQRLNEAIPFSLNWEEIDDIYESSDPPETILSKLIEIPVIRYALQEENTIRSILMELCTNIIRVRDPSTYDVAETMVSSEINWESLVRLINKDKFLSLVHGLAGLALLNPLAIQYRKLSLAACSTYLLSLTIGGSTGYEVFQEKIVQQVLSVFDLVAQVQKKVPFKNQSHLCELWILFTNFVDHLKLAFRSCSLSSSLDLKDLILQKIFDFHDYNFQNGYSNKYALTVHRSLFALLDIFMNPRHGDQETTAKDFVKWTWDFHRYPPEPKKVGFHIPHSDEVVEHISHWFKKSITKYTNVMVNVLHFYIKCVVEIPDKDWHPEHIKQALEYAAKYDVEIYKKANQSIIPYLEDEINSGNGENASRAIELLGYISHQKLQVECSLISATEDIPREVEILRILIDTLLDPNVTIQTKALQSLQAIGSSSNTSGKILTELIVNCKYEDEDITLPFDYPAKIEVIEENVHSYSFTGSEILVDLIQELPQRIYYLLHSKQAHTKRVALCFIEFMVRLNKNIILRSDFCKEMSRLKSDSSVIVTRQAMQSIDSILSTFPNCYPVVWTWCELFTSLLNNPDERNDALGREYFKNKVLDNIRSFDGNKSPEHLLCWEILKTLINITSRLYVQSNISRLMVPNMVSYELITMVSSHVDQKNKYLALVVLNLICPFCSGNLDALVNLAFTNHLFIKKDEFKDDPDGVYTAQARFSDERVILLALDLFTNCIDKFSKLSISKLFDEVIKLLEAGRIFHSTIDRALNLLQHIHKTLDSTKRDPRENEKWADDLYKNLEDKLISWSMEFPENYHQYIPCLMTYVLLNCERIDSVHPELERLVQKQLLMCSSCDESKITHREQFIYSSFIIIAGYLSFRSTHVAVKNCSLFVAILKNCELHSIVKNLTIVYTDISKKHGRIFELFLCEVTEKFVSPDVRNRTAAFECLERLIREEHLLLKKNLLYRIVFVMLDEDAELSNRVIRFFFEFASKKNPKFFQVCLRDFPLDLTGYNDSQGMSYEKINTGLYGEPNRLKREQIYEQFVPLEGQVFLYTYFGKLSEINSEFSDAEKMKTPQAKAMVKDVCYVLKLICKEEYTEKVAVEGDTPLEEQKTENAKPQKAAPGRGKNKEPLIGDVLDDLFTHFDAIWKIAQFYSSEEESLIRYIEDLSIEVYHRFPEFIKLSLNSENVTIKSYWSNIERIWKLREALREKVKGTRKRRGSESSSDSDDSDDDSKKDSRNLKRGLSSKIEVSDVELVEDGRKSRQDCEERKSITPKRGETSKIEVEDVEMVEDGRRSRLNSEERKSEQCSESKKSKQDSEGNKSRQSSEERKSKRNSEERKSRQDSERNQPSTSKTPQTPKSARKSSSKKSPSKTPKRTPKKGGLRNKKPVRNLMDNFDDESDVDSALSSSLKNSTKMETSSDESSFDDQPLFSTFDKIKLSK